MPSSGGATADVLHDADEPGYLFATLDALLPDQFARAPWSGLEGDLHRPPWLTLAENART